MYLLSMLLSPLSTHNVIFVRLFFSKFANFVVVIVSVVLVVKQKN